MSPSLTRTWRDGDASCPILSEHMTCRSTQHTPSAYNDETKPLPAAMRNDPYSLVMS